MAAFLDNPDAQSWSNLQLYHGVDALSAGSSIADKGMFSWNRGRVRWVRGRFEGVSLLLVVVLAGRFSEVAIDPPRGAPPSSASKH
jgi:hypothetical protein